MEESKSKSTKIKKNRCHQCRKKVGLLGFNCECNHIFCSEHRMQSCHNCPKLESKKLQCKKVLEERLNSASTTKTTEHRLVKI
jgi:predicted nucleic acid binding AN1-type Zn finger protein